MPVQYSHHILVVRLSAMGDCAMVVPVLRRLLNTYPQLKITVLTKPFFKPIFETIPNIEVLVADTKGKHKGFWGILKLAWQLKAMRFDAVADLHNVLRSQIIDTVFKLAGVNVAKIDKGRAEKKALTRIENKVFKPLKTTPQRYADVFDALGYPLRLEEKIKINRPELTESIRDRVGNSTQKWIGIAPFAAHQSKTYPLDLMREVIAELDRENQFKIILFGGGQREIEQLNLLEQEFNSVCNAAGKLAFKDELKLIANLDIMLAMDSGNGHLAALYEVPVITLWGQTHPYAGFAPFQQPKHLQLTPDLEKFPLIPTSVFGNKNQPGYEDAMHSISPQSILKCIHTA